MDRLPWADHYQTPQLRRWLDAMPRRFSCRSFSGPADLSQTTALAYAATRVSLKGVRITVSIKNTESLVIPLPLFPKFEGVCQYAAVYTLQDTELARLRAGVSGEAFALEAAAMGLACCWMTGNYRRNALEASPNERETLAAVIILGKPKDPEGARNRKRKPLAAFCPDDPAAWPNWAYKAAEAMRSAPSAMNRQPWKVSCAGQTLSFTGSRLDSIDSGIAIMHLECAAGDYSRRWRLAKDQKSVLLQIEEKA
jgi:hypothetical protein